MIKLIKIMRHDFVQSGSVHVSLLLEFEGIIDL